ncbi:hypothetical protein V8F06_008538 [Rhypophila decipiens]
MISHQSLLAFLSCTIFTLFTGVSAQQFTDGAMDYSVFGNLSPLCQDAINTTISCHSLLSDLASPSPTILFLNNEELAAVCATGCRSSLTGLRSQILLDCSEPTDVMVDGNMAYPATYFVDRFLHAHDSSCFKDQTTNEYCDLILGDANNTSLDCSSCRLGLFASQLSSPFEYADALADEFTSLTASCGASGYSFTSPAPYGSTITITRTIQLPEGTETATCNRPYTVQPGDTCISISQENQVSTYGLIHSNNIDVYCSVLPAQLCLPEACGTYMWEGPESCSKVVEEHEIDMIDWLTWNPIFDSYCTNAGPQFTNWTMCVSPPGGALSPPPVPSAAPVPTNAHPSSETNCAQWYEVKTNDTCFTILPLGSSITFAQFRAINPDIDADCTNLWLGYSYCIRAVEVVSIPATFTYTRPPVTSMATAPPITAPVTRPPMTSTLPHAPSAATSCTAWVNYDASGLSSEEDVVNRCWYVAADNNIRLGQLLEWNPPLDTQTEGGNCTLSQGYSYCVGAEEEEAEEWMPIGDTNSTSSSGTGTASNTSSVSHSTTTSTATTTTTSTTTTGPEPPAPTQPGMIGGCTAYHEVVSGDGCWAISNQYGIELSDFYLWNPGVGSECENLWLGYAVCVGI